jgi:hypothetical protein
MKYKYLIILLSALYQLQGQTSLKNISSVLIEDQSAYYIDIRKIVKQSLVDNSIEKQVHLKDFAIIDSIYQYTIHHQKSWDDSTRNQSKSAIEKSAIFINLGFNNGRLYALLQYKKKLAQNAQLFHALIAFDKDLNFVNYFIKPKHNKYEVLNAPYNLTFEGDKLWLVEISSNLYFQAFHLNEKKHFLEKTADTIQLTHFIKEHGYSIMSGSDIVFYQSFKLVYNHQKSMIAQFPLAILQNTKTKELIQFIIPKEKYIEQIKQSKKANISYLIVLGNSIPIFNPNLIGLDDFNQQITALTYDTTQQKLSLFVFNDDMSIAKNSTYNLKEWTSGNYYALKGEKVYEIKKHGLYFKFTLLAFL